MTRRQRRATFIFVSLGILGMAAGLVLYALSDSVTFFYSPSDVVERGVEPGERIRLGGLVEMGSLQKLDDANVRFNVTDFVETIPVTHRGVLPDLFREGQGVVAEGAMQQDGTFTADKVLAKHDENYMPPEVADALKKTGNWQGEGAEASHAETYGQGSYP
ncbi:cytochrome c maturation protein CcmE [Parvibaculum sp.]|jgi:cytochrome c-type biogenesis protein CcmE|uniref:cytochrome c maturation protein CcmE n=1 Tax=Parvibaculum sp. TaxID=2024848 RepID=UPI000C6BBDED|nr:cytochrome c maturation protein CcmE [Parvibaculum sp.]MAM95306.1 cytochrome c maturation protein CcmE [Parvibaculum sp.]|tara:strand:+ start:4756 stop:5238 length:483 start_codon:yes stop_codon:yes gene_type:complete